MIDEIRKRALWDRNAWRWSPDAWLGLEHEAWDSPSNKVRRNALGQLVALTCGTESSLEAVQVLVSTSLTDPHLETLPEVMSERSYPPPIRNHICLCADNTLNCRRETHGSVQTFNQVQLSCFSFRVEKQIYFLIQAFPQGHMICDLVEH